MAQSLDASRMHDTGTAHKYTAPRCRTILVGAQGLFRAASVQVHVQASNWRAAAGLHAATDSASPGTTEESGYRSCNMSRWMRREFLGSTACQSVPINPLISIRSHPADADRCFTADSAVGLVRCACQRTTLLDALSCRNAALPKPEATAGGCIIESTSVAGKVPTVNAVAAATIGRLHCGCTVTPLTATCWHFRPRAPNRGERYVDSPQNSDAAFRPVVLVCCPPPRLRCAAAGDARSRRPPPAAAADAPPELRRELWLAAAARGVFPDPAQASAAPVALAISSVSSSTCRLATEQQGFG